MATIDNTKTGNAVGATTKGAATGGTLAGAVGVLIVYALVKTGVETDPAMAGVLAGALVTVLGGVGALVGGRFSPTDQGDALHAQHAVVEVEQMVERLAALNATGPAEYEPTPGEQPVVDAVEVEITTPETTGGGSHVATVDDARATLRAQGYPQG